MSRVGEFDRFYEASRKDVLTIAYTMCADRTRARRVTTAAYRAAWRKWDRVRQRDPLSFVLVEVWRHTGLGRNLPVLRLRRERDADHELLAALSKLDDTGRHLVSLMTVAKMDIPTSAEHVGLDEEAALSLTDRSFAGLEAALGEPMDEVLPRIDSLREITSNMEMPSAPEIRARGTRERRQNVAALFAVGLVGTLFAGVLVSQGSPTDTSHRIPPRERLGAESVDVTLDAKRMSTKDLLPLGKVAELRPDAKWKVDATDLDPNNKTPYATCPTRRFADENPLRVFVRAYSTDEGDRVVQSIEVSGSAEKSRKAFKELVDFYADCEHPRVRLVDAWKVPRTFGDFTILRLHSQREPSRFITVGLAQSGALTSTVVHEREGAKDSDVKEFAKLLNSSVRRVCEISGGVCSDTLDVRRTAPPAIGGNPAFLAVVDMPALKGIDTVWSASDRQPVNGSNPAATPCLEASFEGTGFTDAGSRLYSIPGSTELPESFAIAETVGVQQSEQKAKKFVQKLEKQLTKCTQGDLAVKIDEKKRMKDKNFTGTTWRLVFEIDAKKTVVYRMGVVRRGNSIAQVLMPPAGDIRLTAQKFTALVERSGERLEHLNRMDWED